MSWSLFECFERKVYFSPVHTPCTPLVSPNSKYNEIGRVLYDFDKISNFVKLSHLTTLLSKNVEIIRTCSILFKPIKFKTMKQSILRILYALFTMILCLIVIFGLASVIYATAQKGMTIFYIFGMSLFSALVIVVSAFVFPRIYEWLNEPH